MTQISKRAKNDRGAQIDHGIHDRRQKINDQEIHGRENQTDHGIDDRGAQIDHGIHDRRQKIK